MEYDIVTVGGGLSGASLAKAMAERGARVLVIERERRFRDRVRGEGMHPWGVAEAIELGIYDDILQVCGFSVPYWRDQFGSLPTHQRDLTKASPHHVPELCFSHPEMQETVLDASEHAGAEVWRGVRASRVIPGKSPIVEVVRKGKTKQVNARLVVGADGRSSQTRVWSRFEVRRDSSRINISGLLLQGLQMPQDAVHSVNDPPAGEGAFIFPIGKDRFRAYYCVHQAVGYHRLSGSRDVGKFIESSVRAGMPEEWFEGAEPVGPLATFEVVESWIRHPYRQGVALVGDAAATPDPTWGCGLSLALRGVRLLRDHLTADENWESAGHAYAEENHKVFHTVHRLETWMSDMFYEIGPEANARREQAYPHLADEPQRWPDLVVKGPESPSDEQARRLFFAED